MKAIPPGDVTRIMLLVLAISILIAGSVWTLLPFLSALVWATTIALATWPSLLWMQRLAFGKRWLAATLMTLLVLFAFVTPLVLAIGSVFDAADRIVAIVNDFAAHEIGPPPAWLAKLPFIGERIANKWQALSSAGPDALANSVRPYVIAAARWVVAAMGGLANAVILIIFTVAIVAILYAKGELAARGLLAFAYRLGGDTGERTMRLAAQAVRSVALGVVVTAFV
jgi:predicted PurR-regulated permease PerM